jgi:2'-deoxynucleoside 5'-phosphate N-hydrolase
MKAFVAMSSAHKDLFSQELDSIEEALKSAGHEVTVTVRDPAADTLDRRALMARAFGEIDSSDVIIAEVSNISFGVGIEIGYAKAQSKKIITAVKEGYEISKTASGASDAMITYNSPEDLSKKLLSEL